MHAYGTIQQLPYVGTGAAYNQREKLEKNIELTLTSQIEEKFTFIYIAKAHDNDLHYN